MAKKDKLRGGGSIAFATNYESEGSGTSCRFDAGIAVSGHSFAPQQRWINTNSSSHDGFAVPIQVIPLSKMSPSERKNLVLQLRSDLDQIRLLQKKVEFYRTSAVAVSSSSDIVSCSNAHKGPPLASKKKSAGTGPGKKSNLLGQKASFLNRETSGRFKSASAPSTSKATLMKQCENLLKKLMSHQHGPVFNEPVDIVKLKIPDYFTVIKHPMDLGTIKKRLTSGAYLSPLEFLADVRLTFSNAMIYNPPGNIVHIMADTMSKFFELRWKTIEKKLPVNHAESVEEKSGLHEENETASKKRRLSPMQHVIMPEPPIYKMTDEEKHKLSSELEASLGDLPDNIIEFLKEQSSNGTAAGDDEIEIDIDVLPHDTLFTLRELLDKFLQEKQKGNAKAEPCEIELPNGLGLSNSSMHVDGGNDHVDEEVDIGGNEPPVSSYPSVEIEKDTDLKRDECINTGGPNDSDSSSSSDDESEAQRTSDHAEQNHSSPAKVDGKEAGNSLADGDQSISGMDQLEQSSQQMPVSVESEAYQDGESVPDRRVSPEKLYRAALLKNRFADTILKAREKTLVEVEKGDPEKLRHEREELQMRRRKEKAKLQAEARAAEEAQRRAEAEAAAEAKRRRELDREAARQALLQMEKTVEINENSKFLEDLEMLTAVPPEQLPSSVDETSPDHSQDGLGGFKFGGSNALEQLGLYMKMDDDEEECEPATVPSYPKDVEPEEGEID
ncbi:PREDICTED: transcription factor GTE8-like [Nicotiana attenuata]|uniref:Transcription factor gte8 n=1 Tax=Nicotiana attenuata TaxID=49451 RepID=A0A1J6J844_NICAT|nr:PREDICTED: transcription factor GTE8-like [Nicotiana attenuata]XP_019225710.1 PREDICTED: transcription factor GTE8-like [Nicotiana attenuata]OIT05967.1 transcription factor gte8 [Nicotiana attenuata]